MITLFPNSGTDRKADALGLCSVLMNIVAQQGDTVAYCLATHRRMCFRMWFTVLFSRSSNGRETAPLRMLCPGKSLS